MASMILLQIILVVAPSFILFGYNQSNLGGLLSLSDWTKTFPEIDTIHTKGSLEKHNATIQGITVASFTIGALFGALSCSYTGNKFGRRKVIFAGAFLTLIGEALEASAYSLPHLITGRTIIGLGIGMLSGTVPTWQSECSNSKNRGQHVVLDGLFITLGYVLESWINVAFYATTTGQTQWRPPISIPVVFSFLVMGAVFFMPESPRWLAQKDRYEEARIAIAKYRGLDPRSEPIEREMTTIRVSLESTANMDTSLMSIFKLGTPDKTAYRFGLCMLLQFFQQMSGSNLISVYSTVIFQQGLNLNGLDSRLLSGGCLTWKFFSCFIAFFAIDRWGRRAVFMISGTGMALCMASLAIATSFPKSNKSAQIVSVFFVFMFNTFIPIGFLGANFLYCAEIAPLRIRIAMASISTANHWLWNFVVIMVTPTAIATIGYRFYILFAVISACIPLSVFFFYPETMGRTLEEIDENFRKSGSILSIVPNAARSWKEKDEYSLSSDTKELDSKDGHGEDFVEKV